MNLEMNNAKNAKMYLEMLFDFCITFEQNWVKGNIKTWSPPIQSMPAKNLEQLQSSVQAHIDYIEGLMNYAHAQQVVWTHNDDERALDNLKCILHDLHIPLSMIRATINVLLNNNQLPPKAFDECYQTIIRALMRIDLFIEKAFPLLKENKSYLRIDWYSEFKEL